jgi:competence ComEA-like helix-hairpin-helix protein
MFLYYISILNFRQSGRLQMIKKSEKLLIFSLAFLFICALSVAVYMRTGSSSASTISLSAASNETGSAAIVDGRVNINLATAEQLTQLPGIGSALSRKIVEYRRSHGEFQSLEDLLNVDGVHQDMLTEIMPYITTGGNP